MSNPYTDMPDERLSLHVEWDSRAADVWQARHGQKTVEEVLCVPQDAASGTQHSMWWANSDQMTRYRPWIREVEMRLEVDGRNIGELNEFPWWQYFESGFTPNVTAEIAMGYSEED